MIKKAIYTAVLFAVVLAAGAHAADFSVPHVPFDGDEMRKITDGWIREMYKSDLLMHWGEPNEVIQMDKENVIYEYVLDADRPCKVRFMLMKVRERMCDRNGVPMTPWEWRWLVEETIWTKTCSK